MATPGYSGKPLWQKLGLNPDSTVSVVGYPGDYQALVGLPVGLATNAPFVHAFVRSESALAEVIEGLASTLPATGIAWISWPKRASGIATEVTENSIRDHALPTGLVDVKVCAVDENWSGLKLVWRVTERKGR